MTTIAAAPATTCYQIFVKNLRLAASIGIYPFERQARQDILISVDVTVAPHLAAQAVTIADIPSYETIVQAITKLVAEQHIDLVEQLAIQIADHCLADGRVTKIVVRVAKPDIFVNAGEVGCEIHRQKMATS
ncbi:MAG: dihydroneopterin aldolase [Candidatus Symbiobacter sp.]|nr:dihydroneopterin aldolase [Candidatus Symbiobacter sp.]